MYWGSVKFFKQLILLGVSLLILGLIAGGVGFVIDRKLFKERNDEKKAQHQQHIENKEYKKKYTELYVLKNKEKKQMPENTVYLTFDGGPSERTAEILDILDTYQIKATFFVTATEDEKLTALYQDIVDRGHAIGICIDNKSSTALYKTVDSFLDRFESVFQLVEEKAGIKPQIFRFPGGSCNCDNTHNRDELIEEMTRRGFVYFDWDTSSGDALFGCDAASVCQKVVGEVSKKNYSVVLLHDSQGGAVTVSALPSIIEQLGEAGYAFGSLDSSIEPVTFYNLY